MLADQLGVLGQGLLQPASSASEESTRQLYANPGLLAYSSPTKELEENR